MRISIFLSILLMVGGGLSASSFDREDSLRVTFDLIAVDSSYVEDAEILAALAPYKLEYEKQMSKIIAYSKEDMYAEFPQGALSNLTCDIMQASLQKIAGVKADLALLNFRGLRNFLPQGPISKARLYSIYPFENELVYVEIKGKYLLEIFKMMAENKMIAWSKQVMMTIQKEQMKDVFIHHKKVDPEKIYTVVCIDFLYQKGAGIDPILYAESYKPLGILLRDLMINSFAGLHEKGEKMEAVIDNRVVYVEK